VTSGKGPRFLCGLSRGMRDGEARPCHRPLSYVRAARRIVAILGEPAARDLLRVLDCNGAARADLFRQLCEHGGHEPLLDALTDLEADPVMWGWLVEHLRQELGAV